MYVSVLCFRPSHNSLTEDTEREKKKIVSPFVKSQESCGGKGKVSTHEVVH